MKTFAFLIFIVALGWRVEAATYYVATNGNNLNPGSLVSPWLTIQKSANTAVGGDTVRVQPGLYDEKPTVPTSGSLGNYVNFVAESTNAICRGFDIQASYIRVIGFQVFHTNTAWGRSFEFNGTHDYIEILDNYIHNTYQQAILGRIDSKPTYVTIRGNLIVDTGIVSGVTTNGTQAIGNAYTSLTADHWLIEYNTINWSIDFVDVFGENMLVRNNSLQHFSNAHFGCTDAEHSDAFQPGSDGASTRTRNQLYERNFVGDSLELNSHFGIWQDTVGDGDRNILIRGNVNFSEGSGGIGVRATKKVSTYANTFYKISQNSAQTVATFWNFGSDFSTNNLLVNTLIFDYGLSLSAIDVPAGNSLTKNHNIGYLAGTDSSFISTNNPLLANVSALDFHLTAGSPAIASGASPVTITTASGSGVVFDVNDGLLLNDGWGMTYGDTVTVGGTTTRITSIVGNTVTVADSVTWTIGAAVHWGVSAIEDIGALPYGSVPLTAATISNAGTTWMVTPVGDARGVEFYVDGIPTTWVSSVPFTAVIASGAVTAKAYALYAQATPAVTAVAASSTVPSIQTTGNVRKRGKWSIR